MRLRCLALVEGRGAADRIRRVRGTCYIHRMGSSYRIYRLDRANQVVEVDWITAESDEQAVAAARAMNKPGKREVWQGDRLVATIPIAAAEEPSAAVWL